MRTTIIAEVGECFNGNLTTAKEMIRQAKITDCDIVKFQILDIEQLSTYDPEYEWFLKIALTKEHIVELIHTAQENSIAILFTPVSVKTANWLYECGQESIKIASSFIKNLELIDYIDTHFKRVYLSTGMAGLDEIIEIKERLRHIEELNILHCISEYPTGPLLKERGLKAMDEKDASLNMIGILKNVFKDNKIGYSDHTGDIFTAIIAVAMGAQIIEKHFTLDRITPIDQYKHHLSYMGTDHILSALPEELANMVQQIRRVEQIQGEWVWKRTKGELILKEFLRGRYN